MKLRIQDQTSQRIQFFRLEVAISKEKPQENREPKRPQRAEGRNVGGRWVSTCES